MSAQGSSQMVTTSTGKGFLVIFALSQENNKSKLKAETITTTCLGRKV
jgi:hypothetical protein